MRPDLIDEIVRVPSDEAIEMARRPPTRKRDTGWDFFRGSGLGSSEDSIKEGKPWEDDCPLFSPDTGERYCVPPVYLN